MFWFFKKNNTYEPGTAVEEKAEEKFNRLKKCRFINETAESYETEILKHKLIFRLLKENVFAWCESSFSSCTDFSAEADFSFETEDSYSSAGIIFRKGSDFNYYYFLVSNRGFFRIDCVFNGKPMPLVEWTPLEKPAGRDVSVKVTGLGGYFSFYVNGEKICLLHDEIIGKGDITFCCQNYDKSDYSEISLKRFLVNTISYEVESEYSDNKDVSAGQKYNLAKSLYERGKFEPAAVWMESIIRKSPESEFTSSVFSLYGEILINIGMYEDALRCFDRALSMDPDNSMLILEKGNLLYQQGRYLDLLEFLEKNRKCCSSNPVYYDLKGHSAFYLGKSRDAYEYYVKASEYDPENPFYFYNAGKCCEKDDIEEASVNYRKALLLFFRQDRSEDTASVISWFENAGIEDPVVDSIKGKLFFSENNFEEAEKLFRKLIDSGRAESEIYYLNALILYRNGKTEESIKNLETSCSMEPEFPLYFFKLAEFQYASSSDPSEAIEKAVLLNPDDEWVNNLAGLISLDKGDVASALDCLEKAFSKNKDEQILLNYSEALLLSGEYDKALEILDSGNFSSETVIKKGAVYIAAGKYEEACRLLESAYRDDPDNTGIMKSLAEACYHCEKLSRSEELLYLLEGKSPDGSVYNMIGNTARLKGEFARAEAAYLRSLELEYNPVVALNHVEGICEKQDYPEALSLINKYFSGKDIPDYLSKRYEKLYSRIKKEAEITLSCSVCSREWKVPKNTVMNRQLKVVGEPSPESPAGKCPACGKIYCVGCALDWLEGQRFTCPDCSEYLKLSDDYLRYLVSEYAELSGKSQLS